MSKKKVIIFLSLAFIIFTVGFWGIVGFPIMEKNLIRINRIDQSGTIWVIVNTDNGTYQGYLYIDDNGIQKRLEMR